MTGQVFNLNKARKAKAQVEDRKQADANAVKHGLTKAAKLQAQTLADKARRELDGHKLE